MCELKPEFASNEWGLDSIDMDIETTQSSVTFYFRSSDHYNDVHSFIDEILLGVHYD